MGAATWLFLAGLTPKYYPPSIPDFSLAKIKNRNGSLECKKDKEGLLSFLKPNEFLKT
jgi:hypothetical protein